MKAELAIEFLKRLQICADEEKIKKVVDNNEKVLLHLNSIKNGEDFKESLDIVICPYYNNIKDKIKAVDLYLKSNLKRNVKDFLINKKHIINGNVFDIVEDMIDVTNPRILDPIALLHNSNILKQSGKLKDSIDFLKENVSEDKCIDQITKALEEPIFLEYNLSIEIAYILKDIDNVYRAQKTLRIAKKLVPLIKNKDNLFEILHISSDNNFYFPEDAYEEYLNEYVAENSSILEGFKVIKDTVENAAYNVLKVLSNKKLIEIGKNIEVANMIKKVNDNSTNNIINELIFNGDIKGNIVLAIKYVIKAPIFVTKNNICRLALFKDLGEYEEEAYKLLVLCEKNEDKVRCIYNLFRDGKNLELITKISKEIVNREMSQSKIEAIRLYYLRYEGRIDNFENRLYALFNSFDFLINDIIKDNTDLAANEFDLLINCKDEQKFGWLGLAYSFKENRQEALKIINKCTGSYASFIYYILKKAELINLGLNIIIAELLTNSIVFSKNDIANLLYEYGEDVIKIVENVYTISDYYYNSNENIRFSDQIISACENSSSDVNLKKLSKEIIKKNNC